MKTKHDSSNADAEERTFHGGALPGNTGAQLVYFAAERTLLSWIRAALSLMVLGFAVDRLGLLLRHFSPDGLARVYPETYSLWTGTGLVIMGVAMNVVASIRYFRFTVRYRREGSTEPGRGLSLAVLFTLFITLAASGIVVFLVIMTK